MKDKYREPLLYPEDGTFFCCGCGERHPIDDVFPSDMRYCVPIAEFLLGEYERTKGDTWGVPGWVPRVSPLPAKALLTHHNQNLARKKARHHPLDDAIVIDGRGAGEKELQRRLI